MEYMGKSEARARKESDTKMLTGQDYANPLFVILSKFNTAFDKGNAMKKEGYYSIWNGRFDDNFSQAYTKQMTDVWTKNGRIRIHSRMFSF